MHEFSVMSQIVDSILDEAGKRGAKRIEQVDLDIGEYTMLGEEQLRFAYEVLSKDTMLEGSKLQVGRIPGRIRCPSCGFEGPVPVVADAPHRITPVLECPMCRSPAEIIEGRECVIRRVRMVVPDV